MAEELALSTSRAIALLIPVVLERGRMEVSNDAGNVNIHALEDLAKQRRPKIGFLSIAETLKLDQAAIRRQPKCPVLLLPAHQSSGHPQ